MFYCHHILRPANREKYSVCKCKNYNRNCDLLVKQFKTHVREVGAKATAEIVVGVVGKRCLLDSRQLVVACPDLFTGRSKFLESKCKMSKVSLIFQVKATKPMKRLQRN